MNIVLIEDPVFSIDSLKDSIKSKCPVSSQIHVNRNNFRDMLRLKDTTPLLTEGWTIMLSSTLSPKQSALFCTNPKDIVIIETRSRNKNEAIVTLSDLGIEFNVVDNVNVSRDRLVSYCMDKLGINKKDATTLCTRCNDYLPYVSESVSLLESLGRKINRADILRFINKRSSFNVNTLFYHLIGYNRKSREDVACFIYDFRYALPYIKKSLLKILEDCISIYLLMESGFLGADNFKEFNFPKKLNISEYMLKKIIIDVHPVVPLEVLVLVKVSIQKMNKTYQLLNII